MALRVIAGCLALVSLVGDARAAEPVDFARDVRPILESRCLACHGEKKQESELRFDLRDAAMKGGAGGEVIAPGKSAESSLLKRITSTDKETRMPPEGDPLTDEQVDVLRRWIDEGAKWPDEHAGEVEDPLAKKLAHWAFHAPVRPELPVVSNTNWSRNDIDRFVLAKLEQESLAPSPEADKITLLRRLSLDLIGLPPTIAEIDAFLADTSDDAYQKQVDRLLASPHYGERWGRHWLDAARYADSDGFEKDKSRNVWMYRDWVVGAFNRDLPYDQFIIEQFAGDLLPHATQDQIVATGFVRNSMLNEEGGIDPEQFRMEAMFDRMDAVGKSVLGLTIQCCQCHNHKFDPISQEEYYRLFAFLNNDHEPQRVAYSPPELMTVEQLVRSMRENDDRLREVYPDWADRMAAWEATVRDNQPPWEVLKPDVYEDTGGGAKLSLLSDNSMLCAGYAPTHCDFKAEGKTALQKITAVRLETLTDPNLPRHGPGRSFKGTFALTEFKVQVAPANAPDKKEDVKIVAGSADFSQPERDLEKNFDDLSGNKRIVGPIEMAIDGKDETAWGIDAGPGRSNQSRKAVFRFEKPLEYADGAIITVTISQGHGGWNSDDHQNNLLGRIRVSLTETDGEVVADPLPAKVRAIIAKPAAERSPAETDAVFRYWRTTVPEFAEANAQVEALWQQWPMGTTALVLEARDETRETKMLKRGNFLDPTDAVRPGVPKLLHQLPEGAPPTRLTFAQWLADRRSPTTARVFVNRMWQAYFGTGIVSTSEDIGTQSEAPSHPELLDWLATEFMARDWSVKEMHRLIVNSATYRQSSHVNDALLTEDPYNRLLARGPRVRVEGEVVRDIALASSGLLNPALGGPSVFPPVPASLLALSYAPITWPEETGANRYRRALYTYRRRSMPYPALQNFDTPNADFSCVRRQRSNTPLQALTTLNEVVFVECAQHLAMEMARAGGATDDERIDYAFRRCVSRLPVDEERAALKELMQQQEQRFAEGWASPWQVATGKEARPADLPEGVTPVKLAGYTVVARVILNLDETITKE
ncbi:MAG: PSD1 and planctomycete cytochrome C domain-containing protein [Planctomycetia bacterium]|nr:PSD1 and planctomycete cytochrome C domain-containing protein [Planctomycetia bacterium]